MTENTDKIYKLLTTLSKVFDSKTFGIHRDTMAKLIHVDNRIVTQCMRSLKETHHVIDLTLSNDKEYTVTLLKQYEGRLFLICEGCTKEDFERLDRYCLETYRKEQQERIEENDRIKRESIRKSLEKYQKEQIEKANKTEMVLKEIFDKHGIVYEYQHIEIIKDENGEQHGYIYDFLVDFNGTKYDVEIDGSSHDGNEERDKERDKLTRSIGIEPIRFSTQMIYAIADEDNKGRLDYNVIAILIKLDFSSIEKMLNNWRMCLFKYRDEKEENKRLQDENKRLQDLIEGKTIQLTEANNTISQIESILKKSKDEHDSLFDKKEGKREIRDEMARECFLLSKDESIPF